MILVGGSIEGVKAGSVDSGWWVVVVGVSGEGVKVQHRWRVVNGFERRQW